MKQLMMTFALAVMCVAAGGFSGTTLAQGVPCVAATVSGDIQGVDAGASCAFLGVPFAMPPIGSRRWARPEAMPAWAPALLSATTAPSTCPQLNTANGQPQGAEDCLKLNIWTPNPPPSPGSPVIVWFHGGSFVNASANFAPQNGQNLAALTGAIVVAPNYRLGPFGYLRNEALVAEDLAAGNYGLLDQRAALVWVHDHIAAFGGDPGNVTIAGQSAGGHSVSLHLVSPGSAGLFHRAIMQSGSASVRWRTASDAASQGQEFAAALGCTNPNPSLVLACLRTKTRDQILLARPPALFEQVTETGRTQWTPIVEGVEIPDQPRFLYEVGAFSRVPVVIGSTRDEGWTWVNRSFPSSMTTDQYEAALDREFGAEAAAVLTAYPAAEFSSPKDALVRLIGDVEYTCEARRIARLIERTKTPVYLYSFDREIDAVVADRVAHGMDVNFVFGNNYGPPLFPAFALTGTDLALSQAISGYWTRFAATGNPNSDDPSIVHWPAFKHPSGQGRGADKHLVLDSTIEEGMRLREAQCDFWDAYFFRSVTGAVPAAAP
jgi:para-nitrobenzyl esterase